jgi:hypothetical protein
VPPLLLAFAPTPVTLLLVLWGLGVLTPGGQKLFFRADPTDGPGMEDHVNLPLALCATAPMALCATAPT